jgi:hypothetical protein
MAKLSFSCSTDAPWWIRHSLFSFPAHTGWFSDQNRWRSDSLLLGSQSIGQQPTSVRRVIEEERHQYSRLQGEDPLFHDHFSLNAPTFPFAGVALD